MELDIQRFAFGNADGSVVIETKLDTTNFKSGLDRIQNTAKGAGTSIKGIIAGLGITKLIGAAFNTIRNSMDDAISRMDTLNNFPKVMSNLGVSASDSEKSIKKMSDKLAGLPTTLDQGASAVQRFTSKNGDVKKSTNLFLALNNAILAGGAPTEMQATALEQLSQAYAKGKPDMMEWRSAMSAMPAQLKQVAQAMGYVSADELGEALRNGTVSMDDFMDTITKLNTEGVNGFKSFEEQARNSTGGIRTSITVAKTQIVKGVADMIEGFNKGLKKAKLGSLSEIIGNFGKSFKKELDKVADTLSKIDFRKVVTAMKVLIPVVGSLTTAFIGYHSALKAMKIQQSIVAGITAMTNPIGLATAGIAGLTTGILLLGKATEKQDTAQQKINNTLIEYDKVMKTANQARQASLDKNMNEIASIESLYNELQSLVDANGRVKAGYEDRVSFIIGELNNALGTEITMTDGVIQNYNEMKTAIDEVILAKRAKVLLDAEEKNYNAAKDEQAKLEKDYALAVKDANRAEKERNATLKEIKSTYGLTNEQLKQVSENLTYVDKNGKKVNIAFDDLGKKLQANNNDFNATNLTLEQTGKAYADNQKIIGDYENALINLKNGNYQAVLGMYEDTANYQGKTKQSTVSNYQSAIQSQQDYLKYLKSNKNKYNEDVYNAEVNATEARIKQLQDSLNQEQATISTGQTNIKSTWQKGLAEQLSTITGHNIAFVETGKGQVQAYIDGVAYGKPMSKKKAKEFAEEMSNEIKDKSKKGSKQGGEDFTAGFNQGINSGKGSSFLTIVDYGKSILSAFKKSLKEHSPSKASREMGINLDKGFEMGVEDEKRNSLKTVRQYGKDMLNELGDVYSNMQRAVALESGKIFTNVSANNNLMNTTPVKIDLDASVEMDKQKVGRLVTPSVVKTINTSGGTL